MMYVLIILQGQSNMNDSISITWHIDDVRGESNYILNDDQCREVLRLVDKYHDCNIGVNWDVIRSYAEQVAENEGAPLKLDDDDDDPSDLDDRYQIYIACMHGTGQPVKDYDEWLSC